MSALNILMKRMTKLGLIVMLGASLSACAGFFGLGGTSWKEEVLLHDGSKIIVKRTQSYGGGHEIGQTPPVNQQKITFTVPATNKTLSFTSEYSEDIDKVNFDLLALHILNDTPYLVVHPHLCLSYNKWGRPNPPYVIFKYEGSNWKRIPIQELPTEFQEINLVVETKGERKTLEEQSIVSVALVKQLNAQLTQSEFHRILREPIKAGAGSSGGCPEMVPFEGGWASPSYVERTMKQRIEAEKRAKKIGSE